MAVALSCAADRVTAAWRRRVGRSAADRWGARHRSESVRRHLVLLAAALWALPGSAVAGGGPTPPWPREQLSGLPAADRVLADGPGGTWVVGADGSRAWIGDYDAVSWSPRGLYIAAAAGQELHAVTPVGSVRWTVWAPARVQAPRWAPSGFRVAFRAGTRLWAVNGDGTGPHIVDRDSARVAPAWRPHPVRHELAAAGRDGSVALWDVDRSRPRWTLPRLPGGRPLAFAWRDRQRLVVIRQGQADVVSARGRLLRTVPFEGRSLADGPTRMATLSPDGSTIAFVRGNIVHTASLVRRQARWRLWMQRRVTGLAFAPDGSHLAIAGRAHERGPQRGDPAAWSFLTLKPAPRRWSTAWAQGLRRFGGWCCSPPPPARNAPLAAATLPDGRRATLRATPSQGACVTLGDADRTCHRVPVAGDALILYRAPGAIVSGTAPDDVARVLLQYDAGRVTQWRDATLLSADDPLRLRRAGLRHRFGAYVADLPHDARNIVATAFDTANRRMPPTRTGSR